MIKYFISSHKQYYTSTYLPIITSLLESGINSKDIYMVVGGCDSNTSFTNELKVNMRYVPYNSFDLTALVYASLNLEDIEGSHIFLMHDTCLVGPKFKQLVEDYDPKDVIKTLRPAISMNMGLYSKQSIHQNSKHLNQMQFNPTTPEQLQQVKTFFVRNEDIIFKQYPNECYKNYYTEGVIATHTLTLGQLHNIFDKEPYTTYINEMQSSGIDRVAGYGPNLDFYKFQANTAWGALWKIGI